jgi:hypothetical protein
MGWGFAIVHIITILPEKFAKMKALKKNYPPFSGG